MNLLNKRQMTPDQLCINGTALGQLIKLVIDGKVGRGNAKKILEVMLNEDIDPAKYAEENGFIVSNDTGLIDKVIKEAIAADPRAVADFKGSKEKALMALFGKCMKQLKGNCDPQVLRTMLIDEINKA
jgi:aspartyl-tRNA(Asn)/glutamyl-tRNA(Gln) amidotransferase subunit B